MKNQVWKTYEEVAKFLIEQFAQEFGLAGVEGKQIVKGHRSGTDWEIDAKGVLEGDEGFVLVECRRHTKSRQKQEAMASLAYRIEDTGAEWGIIVSPLGPQEGAAKVAAAEKILSVRLDPTSTPTDFGMQFLNKLMRSTSEQIGISDIPTVTVSDPSTSVP